VKIKVLAMTIFSALLISSMLVPISASDEGDDTIAVLIDFGSGRVAWADVSATPDMTAWEALVNATEQLALPMNGAGGGVNSIDGHVSDYGAYWWHFWAWNSTTGEWETGMSISPNTVTASDADAVAWSYAKDISQHPDWVFPHPPLATPEHRYPWASFRHDAMNTGYQPAFAPVNLTLQWQRDLGNGAIDSPIVVVDGFSYVTTSGAMDQTYAFVTNSTVYCLDPNGAIVWKADIGPGGYQTSASLVYGGMLIVQSFDGNVYALDLEDGSTIWTYSTGISSYDNYGMPSPMVYDNKLIVATTDGKIRILNEDGTEAVSYVVGEHIYSSSPAILNGVIYIGTEDGALVANTTSGGAIWSVTLGDRIRASPLLLDDGIVVTYTNVTGEGLYPSPVSGGLARVDYSGNIVWQTDLNVTPSSAALTENGLVVMTYTEMIMVSFDGEVLWTIDLGEGLANSGAPVSVDGTILAITNEESSRLVAATDDGDLYFQQVLYPAQYAMGSPTVSDGLVFVATDSGYMYVYRLNSAVPSVAGFTSGTDGLAASFSASTPAGAGPFSYVWNFGDGNAATGQQVEHTYAEAGLYTVVLNIFDQQGELESTVNSEVDVKAIAPIDDNPQNGPGGDIPIWAIGLMVVAIAVIILAAVAAIRKRK